MINRYLDSWGYRMIRSPILHQDWHGAAACRWRLARKERVKGLRV